MTNRSQRSWLEVLQHIGQFIAAVVALIYAFDTLMNDFRREPEE